MPRLLLKSLLASLLLVSPALLYIQAYYINLFSNPHNLAQSDFVPYLTGAVILKNQHMDYLYQPSFFKTFQENLVAPEPTHHLVYRALPYAALLYLPLTIFKFNRAFSIFFILSFVSLILVNIILINYFNRLKTIPYWFLIIFVIYPVFYTLMYGQTSLITCLLLYLCYFQILKKQYFKAGLILTSLLIKPHLFIIFSTFLLSAFPKLSLFKGLAAGTVITGLLCLFISGTSLITKYPFYILSTENIQYGSYVNNYHNLSAILSPYSIIIILLIALIILKFNTNKIPPLQKLSAITILAPLFAVHTPVYELVVYILPLSYLIQNNSRLSALLFLTLFLPFILNNLFVSIPVFLFIGFYLLFVKNSSYQIINR